MSAFAGELELHITDPLAWVSAALVDGVLIATDWLFHGESLGQALRLERLAEIGMIGTALAVSRSAAITM